MKKASKNTTIYDIAKALNITTSTVSRALNDSPLISIATKKAVVEVAREMNYRPNRMASSLSKGTSSIVGVVIPSARIQFFSTFLSSLEHGLKKAGYSVLLYQTNESLESEKNGIKTLLEAQVEGVIISPSLETQEFGHLHRVQEEGKKLLVFDRVDDRVAAPSVSIDDELAGYLATKHLLDVGYRRIAYVSTKSEIRAFAQRFVGFRRALQEHGMPWNDSWVILDDISIESGVAGVERLLHLPDRPDAIVAGDDFTALGVLHGLKSFGVQPPEIGVIGFANQVFSEYIDPSLTTIDQQATQMGKVSAELFLAQFYAGQQDSVDHTQHIVLQPKLIVRGSTTR